MILTILKPFNCEEIVTQGFLETIIVRGLPFFLNRLCKQNQNKYTVSSFLHYLHLFYLLSIRKQNILRHAVTPGNYPPLLLLLPLWYASMYVQQMMMILSYIRIFICLPIHNIHPDLHDQKLRIIYCTTYDQYIYQTKYTD